MYKKEKNSFVDKIMGPMDKISSPLIKFGQIPFIQGLQRGMVSSIGVTMVGSIFLVICLFGADGNIHSYLWKNCNTPIAHLIGNITVL